VDTVQFYQCWVSRSIGSYPENIFLLPLDYYQADVEDKFEDYWNRIQPVVKKNFGMPMWRNVHPASHLQHKINIGKKKGGVSYPHTDLLPAAPWAFDIFKRKIICFTAKNVLHYGMFAALNAGNLIHGDRTNKQECGLASFDSSGSRQSPLERTAAFVEYIYFLLNICHAIHSWVVEQDEADTDSDAAPDFESMFDVCREATKSKTGGFFNVGNMRPGRIPSAKTQLVGCNCGVYTCLLVLLEHLNPVWMGQQFDVKFLRMVPTASSRAGFYMKWIYVPVGDARQDKKPPSGLVTKFPVHYTQKNHDTCIFKSVASALHHLNKKQIASVVSSMATKYMHTPAYKQLNKLGSIAQENDCDFLVTKWMTRKRVGKFDLKTETSHCWALVVIPLGGDGGIGHAITIVGDLIFNTTQSHALKLGKNSLDW
jgi:hypothetical protein